MSERTDLLNEIPPRVEELLAAHFKSNGVPSYRVRQAMVWIYEKDARGFAEMTGGDAIRFAVIAVRPHGVHQVIGDIDAHQRALE